MDKIVKKMYFAWQIDKEKAFLENMAKKGYKLCKLRFGKYYFKKIEPQNLIYQFDFQIIGKEQREEYLEVYSDWECCASYGSWFYFCKNNPTNEELSIFNDQTSQISMFRKLIMFLLIIAFPLYYQVIIIFPNMNPARLQFPRFYFFARIIIVCLLILHTYAIVRIIHSMKKLKNNISE